MTDEARTKLADEFDGYRLDLDDGIQVHWGAFTQEECAIISAALRFQSGTLARVTEAMIEAGAKAAYNLDPWDTDRPWETVPKYNGDAFRDVARAVLTSVVLTPSHEAGTQYADLVKVVEAALGYIDAIPKETANAFPAMPGFDRDWAADVLHRYSNRATEPRREVQAEKGREKAKSPSSALEADGSPVSLTTAGTQEPVAWRVDGPLPLDSSEVFLSHDKALAAFNDWGKRITPLFAAPQPASVAKQLKD